MKLIYTNDFKILRQRLRGIGLRVVDCTVDINTIKKLLSLIDKQLVIAR